MPKGSETDEVMEYILSRFNTYLPIKARDLQDMVNLSESAFKAAVKKLYDGLFIIRTPNNYYQKLRDIPDMTKAEARKLVVRRIIENFGIFTAEGLASFLKRGFSMEEIRTLLRELETEGDLSFVQLPDQSGPKLLDDVALGQFESCMLNLGDQIETLREKLQAHSTSYTG